MRLLFVRLAVLRDALWSPRLRALLLSWCGNYTADWASFVAFSVYAGLTQVSEEVIEAAQLDGANGWQRFRLITAPLIRPVLSIVVSLVIFVFLRDPRATVIPTLSIPLSLFGTCTFRLLFGFSLMI